jgi:hypothetical protein
VSQQINLFNPVFLKQKKHFSAVTMLQSLGLVLLGSVALGVYASFQVTGLHREADAISIQLKATQARLTQVNAAQGSRTKSKALEEQMLKAEAEVAALQQVTNILRQGDLGNAKGYSEYFRAFSRQIVDGVWLTSLYIAEAGGDIVIQGRATQPQLVTRYINRLKQEQVMQGKSFATLEMHTPQAEPANRNAQPAPPRMPAVYIDFRLQSSEAVKEQAGLAGAKSK